MRNGAGDACNQYTCPPSGGYNAMTEPDQKVPNAGDVICTGGCGYVPSSWKVGQDGQIWATWPFKSSGSFCNGAPSGSNPLVNSGELNHNSHAPIACSQNTCPGSVNGATVCVPCSRTQDAGSSTAASAPGTGASGATNSTTTNSCNGVTCTTTTTSTDGNGNVTGTQQQTQQQESFCKQNPESTLCKPSSFGGACAATTCNGDAVMCAIAADQYRRNCQWFEDPDAVPLKNIGNEVMNGQVQPDGHPAKDPTQVGSSLSASLDQTDAIGGGGSCPADVPISLTVPLVGATALNLELSKLCGPLQLVGQVLVACTLLWAGVFVYRGASA